MSPADQMMEPSWLNGPNWLYESQGDELESQDLSGPDKCLSEIKGTQDTHNLLSSESNSCNGIFNYEINGLCVQVNSDSQVKNQEP